MVKFFYDLLGREIIELKICFVLEIFFLKIDGKSLNGFENVMCWKFYAFLFFFHVEGSMLFFIGIFKFGTHGKS